MTELGTQIMSKVCVLVTENINLKNEIATLKAIIDLDTDLIKILKKDLQQTQINLELEKHYHLNNDLPNEDVIYENKYWYTDLHRNYHQNYKKHLNCEFLFKVDVAVLIDQLNY
jgi:DNA gyrase/topoisomerase IV subunit A